METIQIEKIKDQPMNGPWKNKKLIPYRNSKGHYVWKVEGDSIDMQWPGFKSPKWATDLVEISGVWYWVKKPE